MQSFLDKTASEIYKRHELRALKDQCVILPSRRATFFFKQALSKLSDMPFVAPHVYAVDDFVCQLSGLQLADNISLLFELYGLYKKNDEQLQFNEFIKWGATILKDFDLIDQYLVPDPQALFNYMGEVEALSRWTPDSEKSIELTENTNSYFRFYEELNQVYHAFHQKLIEKELAYRGMAYRTLAEGFEEIVFEDFPFEHFYFVGLNALSKSEEQIIKTLVKAKRATCFWDTDEWFMKSDQQAGSILRRYKKKGDLGDWNEPDNLLTATEKEINIYESPFETLQTKIGTNLLDESPTVFVVPDENLIQPLLFSLGNDIAEYNITMGLGMKQSKIWQLLNTHFELQTEGLVRVNGQQRFHHKILQKVLTDPLVKLYERINYPIEQPYQALSKSILAQNKVFLSLAEVQKALPKDPLFKVLMADWAGRTENAVNALQKLLQLLQESLSAALDAMEREFFMLLFSVLNRLEDEIRTHKNLSVTDIEALFNELSKQERVPFTGEPIAPLQIMSLLETRCLDFEHVVFFSFNEGVIPSSQKNNSLIPYEACKAFGIPVFSDQDSIMSYHFYRLMMRAKKVDIIYANTGSSGIGGGKEQSRFILQLINNLAPESAKIKLTNKRVELPKASELRKSEGLSVIKSDKIREKAKAYLVERGLSASALNTYFTCTLRFYFSKVLGLKDLEEVEETFAADVFGEWIHFSIEYIANELLPKQKVIPEEMKPRVLSAIPKVLNLIFDKHFKGYQVDRGINLIYRNMAQKLLKEYYEKCVFSGARKVNIASEIKLSTPLFYDRNGDQFTFALNGTIDSIELHDQQLTLIDFKTGKVDNSALNISAKQSSQEAFVHPGKSKYRQMLVYKYLVDRELDRSEALAGFQVQKNTNPVSGMISFRELDKFFSQDTIPLAVLESELEANIFDFVEELLSAETAFTQTKDVKNCEYCSFKTICNR